MCAVDNGDLLSDTEIGRIDHCWMLNRVIYEDVEMIGCTVVCRVNGCNTAGLSLLSSSTVHSFFVPLVVNIAIWGAGVFAAGG